MFCGKCGAQIDEGMEFCPKCGNPIRNNKIQSKKMINEKTLEKKNVSTSRFIGIICLLAIIVIAVSGKIILNNTNNRVKQTEFQSLESGKNPSAIDDEVLMPLESLNGNLVVMDDEVLVLRNNGKIYRKSIEGNAEWKEIEELDYNVIGIWKTDEYDTGSFYALTKKGMIYCIKEESGETEITRDFRDVAFSEVDTFEQNGWWITVRCKNGEVYLFDLEKWEYYRYDSLPSNVKVYGYNEGYNGFLMLEGDSVYNVQLKEGWSEDNGNELETYMAEKEIIRKGVKEICYESIRGGTESFTTFISEETVDTYYYSESEKELHYWEEDLKDELHYPEGCGKMYIRHCTYLVSDINSYYLLNGSIYTMGNNRWGQLGIGSEYAERDEYSEIGVAEFIDLYVVNTSTGSCYALDSFGNIWVWGSDFNSVPQMF